MTTVLLCLLLGAGPTKVNSPSILIDGEPTQVVVRYQRASSVGDIAALSGERRASEAEGRKWLTFELRSVEGVERNPPLLGSYLDRGVWIDFRPRFKLVPGATYVACAYRGDGPNGRVISETTYTVPAAEAKPPTTVAGVSPNLPTLPANVLKFYVSFTAPMREGREVLERIKLLDDAGRELGAPWRDLELWNADATRLSLFVHPGRIKQGVNLREDFGPVLTPGRKYTLVVGTDLLDAAGQPLAREFRYEFLASDELRRRIDVAAWSLAAPESGERDPLVVTFDRPLDRHLALRALTVHDAAGQTPLGQGEVSPDGRRWSWTPVDRWSPGDFKLQVDPVLEDLCGNSPQRAFDHDLETEQIEVLPPLLERAFSVE
ncbi:MAG: hypothetical protein JNK76_07935 [Planctomycetales bacterium]|nr:hypothetical protein [Planctomycetales bacterium]MBN8625446.1 hypothetical protein [Planctomycetota bacterium]